ncbi:MAG TPA: hypothetical protein VJV03_07765 [Pyrinomonadaceae bacterium]|nr:hypothetical protein [Pyrinomonadaceae bacterium]
MRQHNPQPTSGGVAAKQTNPPHGKPEAYRSVLRQSRATRKMQFKETRLRTF